MTFAQWFMQDFETNLLVVAIIAFIAGMCIGSSMERSIKR